VHLDCLSPTPANHTEEGGFPPRAPAGLPVLRGVPGRAGPDSPCLSSGSYPAFSEGARKSIVFSQAAGESFTDVCINPHVPWLFPYEESEPEHTFFLAGWKAPEETLAVSSNGVPCQALGHTVQQPSSRGLCDPTPVGPTAALLHFTSFSLRAAFDVRIAGK